MAENVQNFTIWEVLLHAFLNSFTYFVLAIYAFRGHWRFSKKITILLLFRMTGRRGAFLADVEFAVLSVLFQVQDRFGVGRMAEFTLHGNQSSMYRSGMFCPVEVSLPGFVGCGAGLAFVAAGSGGVSGCVGVSGCTAESTGAVSRGASSVDVAE